MCIFFAEYIGSTPFPKVPIETVPINPDLKEFHYLLAFARDYDEADNHTNGKFKPYWDTTALNAEAIKDIKGKYPNVKVVVSIGGRGDQYPFKVDPNNVEQWISNATTSLTQIILDYDLNGIDLYYESVTTLVQPHDFANYLGQVVHNLKTVPQLKARALSISIAPSGALKAHYSHLHQQLGDHVDWVHYQFYHHQVPTKDAFVGLYNEIQGLYPRKKVLAGFSTDEKDKGKFPPKVFSESCKVLLETTSPQPLVGIFVWNTTGSLINYPVHIQNYA